MSYIKNNDSSCLYLKKCWDWSSCNFFNRNLNNFYKYIVANLRYDNVECGVDLLHHLGKYWAMAQFSYTPLAHDTIITFTAPSGLVIPSLYIEVGRYIIYKYYSLIFSRSTMFFLMSPRFVTSTQYVIFMFRKQKSKMACARFWTAIQCGLIVKI